MSARIFMEQSVPELEDLQRKGLFERKEITMIMRRRTDFEQRTQGRGAQPRDFLRYADFESNLDKLRLKRISRLGKSGKVDTSPSISDRAGFRRVVSIFERAVRRFPGDLDLWKNYIRYVKDHDAVKVVYRVYGKLLSLQPRNTDAWISAAKYEFEENANARGARDLYMRGLRFNPDKERLWLSYAQFELAYVAKLLTRRKLMGLSTQKQQQDDLAAQHSEYERKVKDSAALAEAAGMDEDYVQEDAQENDTPKENDTSKENDTLKDNEDVIKVDVSDDENNHDSANANGMENVGTENVDLNVLGNPDSNPVLKGDIALALFDSCVAEMLKGIAEDMKAAVAVRTCRHFLALFDQFDVLNREYLHYHVIRYLQDNYPSSADTVFLDVTLPLRNVKVDDAALAESLQLSVNKFLAYKQKATAEEKKDLTKRFIDYLTENYVDTSGSVSDRTKALLKAIIQKCR